MQRVWTVVLIAGLALASTGCNSTCGNIQQADKDCGANYDSDTCNNAMSSCSDQDQKTLNAIADCEKASNVCSNGSVANGFSYLGCLTGNGSLSNSCSEALSK